MHLSKRRSFKLNQPIYQIRNLRSEHMLLGNQVFVYKNIACKFVSTKTCVNSHECEHSIKIGLRAKFRVFVHVFAYVWVCMSCKLEHAWCYRRCFPRLFPLGLLSMGRTDPENSLESSLDLVFKAPSCTAGSPALGCLGQDRIHRKVFHENATQESRLFPANSETAP